MVRVGRVVPDKLFCRQHDASLFCGINRLDPAAKPTAAAKAHFYEHEQAFVYCNDIDLATAAAEVPLDDPESLRPDPAGCERFREMSGELADSVQPSAPLPALFGV